MVYLVPVAAMIAAGVLAAKLATLMAIAPEPASVVGGLAGLAVSLLWIRRRLAGDQGRQQWTPVVLRHQ